VRAALGEPLAFASQGFEEACSLLRDWTRRRAIPLTEVRLPDATLVLGVLVPGRAKASLSTGNAAMMKLFAGRPVEPADYQLAGATAKELAAF
jgi:hypothetical protein